MARFAIALGRIMLESNKLQNTVTVHVSGKPLAKERIRVTREGHVYPPERTVNYEGRVALAAQHAMDGRPLFDGPLSVEIDVLLPVPQSWSKKKQHAALCGIMQPTGRPDLDNLAKIADALNLIVWADDAQITDLHIRKKYSSRPSLQIVVRSLDVFS